MSKLLKKATRKSFGEALAEIAQSNKRINVMQIDGHDFEHIEDAVNRAKMCLDRPSAIVMKTSKGKCISYMENNVSWHGAAPNEKQFKLAKSKLDLILSELEV